MRLFVIFLISGNLFAGTVALFEIGPSGASDIRRLSYLSLSGESVSYVICRSVKDDYERCFRETGASLSINEFDEKFSHALGLDEYYRLSHSYSHGVSSVQQYREMLKGMTDSLDSTEAGKVEADLEKAQLMLESVRTAILKIQKENSAYRYYLQVLNPLRSNDESTEFVQASLYSTVHDKAINAVFSVFQDYRTKNNVPAVTGTDEEVRPAVNMPTAVIPRPSGATAMTGDAPPKRDFTCAAVCSYTHIFTVNPKYSEFVKSSTTTETYKFSNKVKATSREQAESIGRTPAIHRCKDYCSSGGSSKKVYSSRSIGCNLTSLTCR